MPDHSIQTELRKLDYERYICCLFEKAAQQPRLFALLALNQELASTVEAASEPAVGAIRLKWWQEALEGKRPVSEHPLLPLLQEQEIGAEASILIEARMQELEHRRGFDDMARFTAYLRESAGRLHALMVPVAMTGEHEEIVLRAGAFYGLIGHLRAMPYALERGIVRQPLDILQRYSISPQAVEQGLEKEAFVHLMQFWLEDIRAQAQELQAPVASLPKELALVKRLHQAALLYAKALSDAGGNPAHLPPRLPNLPLKLWWYGLSGKSVML